MQILFNSSMPRSGSELFQAIVHQNPMIYGSSTSPLMEYQFGARGNYDLAEVKSQDPRLMLAAFTSMCGAMAEGYYRPITDRPYVMDKNRGWLHYYEWVEQWCPNPKMICIVRDLRSVFASMEKIYRANRHSPECPDNPSKIENMTLDQRIQYWGETQPIGLALPRTFDCLHRQIDKKVLFIRYEDLCNYPEDIMGQFYRYIGLDYFKHDFNHIVKEVYEDSSHFGIFGDHSVKSIISPVKDKPWEPIIGKTLSDIIVNQYKWFYNYFNYQA